MKICNSPSTNQSLNLVISKHSETQSLSLSFSIYSELHDPISVWSSNCSTLRSAHTTDLPAGFLHDIICGVLSRSLFRLPNVQISEDSGKIFNLAAFTLAILVSIYEAPSNLRHEFIKKISAQLMRDEMRCAAKKLMLMLGELWMRSVNLGVTNWTMEGRWSGDGSPSPFTAPSPFTVFSYALSASRLWKVQVYCPVVAMIMEHPSRQTKDEKMLFSLNYQQLEGVIQFSHTIKENWIDVTVKVDNIRCDLVRLVSEALMAKQGYGSDEKHFPSRVSLQLTPMAPPDILSLSVSRSTDNPVLEVGGLDASPGVMPAPIGIGVSAHEAVTPMPWKFEHAVHGNTASLGRFLHDGARGGREVSTGEPGVRRLPRPRPWFRGRYISPGRPFTRGGGMIFAGGEGVCWRMRPAAAGKTVEWEVRTRTPLHTETRTLEFRELLQLTLAE
ncbi:LOW QUALITY PROTEIN: hypothetical protein GQ55_2G080000 [Panicum hallii var. hallii]|uniref:Uncharacterized protein n=1 Tax=Panicum hallii var. hallii TaxID=1504633 RepID=A0A2T7EMN3_9POAL|nr:LOW QUALITY PROTEIN: hypothetical protein GQ55_2G080000 [Panicum hallii var. hallii]